MSEYHEKRSERSEYNISGATDEDYAEESDLEYCEEEKEKLVKVELQPSDFYFGSTLGEGAYARVVHAKSKKTNDQFAVKIMEKVHIKKENKVKQVMMERHILSMVSHPFLIKFHFSFQDPGYLYMCMDLAPGGELGDLILQKQNEKLEQGIENEACDYETTRFYCAEIVEALEYLHGLKILHRDLKPENILLSGTGHVKITDFGTSALMDDDSNSPRNSFVGTQDYVSPEVLAGDRPATKACDLWALGCMVYQMLTGISPFREATEYLTFEAIMGHCRNTKPLQFPSIINEEAKDLIVSLLKYDENERLGAGEDTDLNNNSSSNNSKELPTVSNGSSSTVDNSEEPSRTTSLKKEIEVEEPVEIEANGKNRHHNSKDSSDSGNNDNYNDNNKRSSNSNSSNSNINDGKVDELDDNDANCEDTSNNSIPIQSNTTTKNGYQALKNHAFFRGTQWGRLSEATALYIPDNSCFPSDENMRDGALDEWLLEGDPTPILSSKHRGSDRFPVNSGVNGGDGEHNQHTNHHSNSSHSSSYSSNSFAFSSSGKAGLFSKKRQLILTDLPRLLYVDPDSMEKKGEIPWTEENPVQCHVKNQKEFDVFCSQSGRAYHLSDAIVGSQTWTDWINMMLIQQQQQQQQQQRERSQQQQQQQLSQESTNSLDNETRNITSDDTMILPINLNNITLGDVK